MSINIHIVNAFTDTSSPLPGGNLAGVMLNAAPLSATQKQNIAARVGLSETAFISPSDIANFKIEFFTPTQQIAQCGHATVAAFSLLREFGMVNQGKISAETMDGPRTIIIGKDKVFLEQRAPKFVRIDNHRPLYKDILQSLNLKTTELPPYFVDTGNRFLIIPLSSAEQVKSLEPDMDAITTISRKFGLVGYYAFSHDTELQGRVASARMFAPAYGINEEAATGMAAGCLAAYLHRIEGQGKSRYLIEQGYLMPIASPSVIDVRIKQEDGQPLHIIVGGHAELSHIKTLDLE